MKLDEGENIEHSWRGTYEGQIPGQETVQKGKHLVKPAAQQNGVFVLTDRSIFWIEQGSALDENYRVNLKIALEDINDISAIGTSTPLISLIETRGAHLFLLLPENPSDNETRSGFIEGSEFLSFKQTILSNVAQKKKLLEAAKNRPQVVLDFSFLKE